MQYLAHARRSFNVCTTNALDRLLFDTLIIQTSPTRKKTIKKRYKKIKFVDIKFDTQKFPQINIKIDSDIGEFLKGLK